MDILEHLAIERPCELCGTRYAISARVARGPAGLIDASLLDELSAVWARIEAAARESGVTAVLSPSSPSPSTDALGARLADYREAKIQALRGAREETSIEHAGHYDTDTHPPSSAVTSERLEHERDAAIALADEVLARSGAPCCTSSRPP